MPASPESAPPVSPRLAVALTGAGFFALLIAGFGMLSLFSGAEVLPVTGLGQAPGITATLFATLAVIGATWSAVRRPRPAYGSAVLVAVAAFLAYLLGLVVGAVFGGTDSGRAFAAIAGFATSWFALVLASAALVSGWTAVALVRTRADRPRWPWERGED